MTTDHDEALRRIREAARSGATELSLFGLAGLARLPEEIAGLAALRSLDLGRTGIADIAPLAALPGLQIVQLVGTPALQAIQDLQPLMDARDLAVHFRDHPPAQAPDPAPAPFTLRGATARLDTTRIAEWEAAHLDIGEAALARIGAALLAESFAPGTRRLVPGLPLFLGTREGMELLFLAGRDGAGAPRLTLGGLARPGGSPVAAPEG
ncbi:hypothetical protein, partial [Mangrovicoccus algicola]